jgi:hypothetical protein
LTQKNGQLKKVSAFYADCFLVPDLTPQSFTISFNYAGEGKICAYGNKQDLEFRRVDQQIQLWQKNSHVADINLNKTSQKWQNLTFSYDGMEKYLHLFSGKNYLGSFRLKEKLSVESKVFSFNSKNVFLGMMIQDFQAFNGKKLPDGPIRNIASKGVSYGK